MWHASARTIVRFSAAMAAVLLVAMLAVVLLARLLPKLPLSALASGSTAITADGGELLRLTLATDGQYRLWVSLEQMPPRLPAAVVLYEDQWFYTHFGINVFALARAALHNVTAGHRFGASTLSMQLARRVYHLGTRTTVGKLRQIFLAVWLELRYSKHDILEAYLNLAPYGHNIEGVGAASLIYFGTPVNRLSVPQILTLAVIPQNPRERRPGAAVLDAARNLLWNRWLPRHPDDAPYSSELTGAVPSRSPEQLPFLAPHFTDAMLRTGRGEVHTTLDLPRQRTVERILQNYVANQSAVGIRNAGALLLEVNDGRALVRAYVGSADYRDAGIDGQVNAVLAKRSPGSALKPFVYGLALDQGLLQPRTILKDVPTAFGPFSPENFDGRFVGPIAAEDALIRSRNVPAVLISSELSRPSLYDFLKSGGVSRMRSEHHYGLALALGGGEISMEELGRLYALLLNDGRLPVVQAVAAAAPPPGEQLLSPESSFIVLDMLKKNPRPDSGRPAEPSVAWKTGTSWGFHDAWSAAVFGRYVLVVWIGNFDNSGNPAFVGVQAAAPLLFHIVDALRGQGQDEGEIRHATPRGVARVDVCEASGDLPNAFCPRIVSTWYIPGKSPIRVSDLHRPVFIDSAGRRVCGAGPGIREEVFEFWPSQMLQLFREAGMPRRVPPPAPHCAEVESGYLEVGREAPKILSPVRGLVYTLRLGDVTPLALRASAAADAEQLYWFADGAYIGKAATGASLPWLPASPGRYLLRVVDESGSADSRELTVDLVP